MCGRYTLATPAELISEHFDLPAVPPLQARYNIAPSQESLIVGRREDGSRAAGLARWGLTSALAAGKRPQINARIETVHQRPAFRGGFARRRCLVVADGFYEWQAGTAGKVPHYFSLRDGRPFALAGIWNQPVIEGEPVTYSILTTVPNALVEKVHQRMPVILEPETYDTWLARRELPRAETATFANPFPEAEMQCWPVAALVNRPANETAACIAPADNG